MADDSNVLVLGAGLAGAAALRKLRDRSMRVTVVDRSDHHTFLPLLYQVATQQLTADHICTPIERLVSGRGQLVFMRGQVTGIDLEARHVFIENRSPLEYDYLVIALGAVVNFFGAVGAQEHSFPLYTISDAERLRARVVECLTAAAESPSLVADGVLRFCVVGGGATGVEAAGALADLLREEATQDAGIAAPLKAEVHILEMREALLMPFKPALREHARRVLAERGVVVHLGEAVAAISPTRVTLTSGEVIKAHTVVWAAGLQGHPVVASLGLSEEAPRPRPQPDLSLPGHPEVFLVGDDALVTDNKTGEALPQLGSVAQQTGEQAAKNIGLLVAGRPTEAFKYKDKGSMAMIGDGEAVVQFTSGRSITGRPAWLAWRGVHLALLAGGEEKARTLVEWTTGWTRKSA